MTIPDHRAIVKTTRGSISKMPAQYLEHHGTRTARKWLHLTYTEVTYTLGKSTKDILSKSNEKTLHHKITK